MTLWIGLTGGIGSGKSSIAQMFSELGVPIIDADAISRSLTAENGEALPTIRQLFGDEVFDHEGRLNRMALREEVFRRPQSKKQLENLLLPLILNKIQQQGAGIGQVGLPAVVSACSGIERDMRGRIVLRQVGGGDAPAAYVLVFFYQDQIAVGNVDFVQRQQAVAGLIDGFVAAQCEQVGAQYGGEADVQALFGSGDLLFRQAAAGVAKLVEGSDVVESVHGVAGGSG